MCRGGVSEVGCVVGVSGDVEIAFELALVIGDEAVAGGAGRKLFHLIGHLAVEITDTVQAREKESGAREGDGGLSGHRVESGEVLSGFKGGYFGGICLT